MVKGAERTRINYLYMLDIPQQKSQKTGYQYIAAGLFYWDLALLFNVFALANEYDGTTKIDLPFNEIINKIAVMTQGSNTWIFATTFIGLIVFYYGMLFILTGRAQGARTLLIVIFKTFTPWAHHVNMNNFLMGTLTTSMCKFFKDLTTVVTGAHVNPYVLCTIAAYPSVIRVIQCYKKF